MGIFGAATSPFIYKSVDWWRTIHPKTSVVPTLGERHRRCTTRCCFAGRIPVLFVLLLSARVMLENQRAELDRLYLAEED